MSETLLFNKNGISLIIGKNSNGRVHLLYFGTADGVPESLPAMDETNPLLAIQGPWHGSRTYPSWGAKQNLTIPGSEFLYSSHREEIMDNGTLVEMVLKADFLEVKASWRFFDELPIVRAWISVTNCGAENQYLEQAASFLFHGISRKGERPWNEKSFLHYCSNSWSGELRWHRADIRELGLDRARENTSNRIKIGSSGTWSTKDFLPIGLYENSESTETLFWQIETNGSWSWEIADGMNQLYLLAQGPNEVDNHWFKNLMPGETFVSVPIAVGSVKGGFDEAMGVLTHYRRRIMRRHWDNEKLPVIFNDYMNCLMADPTTEKELPYIQTASELGVEIYVIDAGWYSRLGEHWWDSVGEWQPSPDRFEGGIQQILATICSKGMIPGLWLEIEAMGIKCPLVKMWPKECFFMRRGLPLIIRGRYQLDFRHPLVIAHANEVIDRLVRDYGIGFIKMDYNIESGVGTDIDADSLGDGLLEHNRAYIRWLDSIWNRYPHLIIENCSSGGMRMDYGMSEHHSLLSVSDQENFSQLAKIALMGPSGAVPEQVGVWVYPKADDSREAVIMNCVNGLSQRIYLSGQVAYLTAEHLQLVREAIEFYKIARLQINRATPFWPFGPHTEKSIVSALGLKSDKMVMLSVWNFGSEETSLSLNIPELELSKGVVARFYPADGSQCFLLRAGVCDINLPAGPCARTLMISYEQDHTSS